LFTYLNQNAPYPSLFIFTNIFGKGTRTKNGLTLKTRSAYRVIPFGHEGYAVRSDSLASIWYAAQWLYGLTPAGSLCSFWKQISKIGILFWTRYLLIISTMMHINASRRCFLVLTTRYSKGN